MELWRPKELTKEQSIATQLLAINLRECFYIDDIAYNFIYCI